MVFEQSHTNFAEGLVEVKKPSKKALIKSIQKQFKYRPEFNYDEDVVVSYSQYSKFRQCPNSWYRQYVTKEVKGVPAIHFVFGTAVHEVLQDWITIALEQSEKEAKKLDYRKQLQDTMVREYQSYVEKHGQHFSTPEELSTFYKQGVAVIEYFIKKRSKFISLKDTILVGVEIPIVMPVLDYLPNVKINCFLDLVLYSRSRDMFIVIDIKTGKRGWSKWDKQKKEKTNQLVIYKHYFCKQYDIPPEKVEIEYLLTKRIVYEDGDFPEKRITTFSPSHGKVSLKRALSDFEQFVDQVFNKQTQQLIKDTHYAAIAGKNSWNCAYCALRDNEELCPSSKRICD